MSLGRFMHRRAPSVVASHDKKKSRESMARLEFLLCIIIKLVKERVSRAKFLRRGGGNVAENRLFCERKRIAHYLLFLLKITCDPAQVRRNVSNT
jgi:hypothetical protein